MQSILQIVTFGDVDYNFKKLRLKHKLTPTTIIALLDMLFGDGFAIIVKRPILTVYKEYMTSWRNVPFEKSIAQPSARDIAKVYRFVNTPLSEYTAATRFIVTDINDFKLPQVNYMKVINK